MLVTEKETITEERDVIKDILCNVCGDSLKQDECGAEGMVEHEMTFGYGSRLFGDMTHLKFSICEGCLFGWSRTWKHSPIDPEDGWWDFWKKGCICHHPSENNGHAWLANTDCPVHGDDAPGVTPLHSDPTPNNCMNIDYRCACAGNLLDGRFYRTKTNPECNEHGDRRATISLGS